MIENLDEKIVSGIKFSLLFTLLFGSLNLVAPAFGSILLDEDNKEPVVADAIVKAGVAGGALVGAVGGFCYGFFSKPTSDYQNIQAQASNAEARNSSVGSWLVGVGKPLFGTLCSQVMGGLVGQPVTRSNDMKPEDFRDITEGILVGDALLFGLSFGLLFCMWCACNMSRPCNQSDNDEEKRLAPG